MVLACFIGSVQLPIAVMMEGAAEYISGNTSSLPAMLLELRFSRALAAFSIGASLSLAGCMMQVLLRNPLADPYVLGVSSGASVGALLAMLFLGAAWHISTGAFIGAVLISLLLYLFARRDLRGGHSQAGRSASLILTGVILSAWCGALVMLILTLAADTNLRGMIFWLVGDMSGVKQSWLPWAVLILSLLFAMRAARSMNLLALYDRYAITLGVRVDALRQALFVCAALLTASAVAIAGNIGFVGLIIPHACRYAWGSDHRVLIPASCLTGGVFLVIADTLARSLFAPQQLPVGIVTAMLGVPVFLWQLHKQGRL